MVKQKYSRKDEKIHPWSFASLQHGPEQKKQNFHTLSELAMFKSLKHRPKPILFPDYLYHTPNYFYQPWSLNTHRRVKNIIIALESDDRDTEVASVFSLQSSTLTACSLSVPYLRPRVVSSSPGGVPIVAR